MNLQQLARQQKQAILDRDQTLANEITYYYDTIWQNIFNRLQQLTKQIADAQAAGQPVKLSWLYEQNRMQLFLDQVNEQISIFADYAQFQVYTQMHTMAQIAAEDAIQLLENNLAIGNGSFNTLPAEAIQQAVYNVENDAHLKQLFSSFDDQAVDAVKKRLITAVGVGQNPRVIANSIQQALQIPLHRALTIARTECINAYRDAAINTYRANSDVVQGWIWDAAADACSFCTSMNGTHHSLDEDMESHPNCRCAATPDTISYDDILAEAS